MHALYYFDICGQFVSTKFFYMSETARFWGKKVIEHKMCVIFSLQSLKHFSLLKELKRDIVTNVHKDLYEKYRLFLCDFNET